MKQASVGAAQERYSTGRKRPELRSIDLLIGVQVAQRAVEGREIIRRRTDKVRLGKDRAFAALQVKPGELTSGDYILILFGQTSDGRSEEIDRYFFRVS